MTKSNKENILRKKIGSARTKLEQLSIELEQVMDLSVKVATELDLIKNNQTSATYPGLNFINLRNSLCDLSKEKRHFWIPSILATSGSGPWDEQEFDEFLRNRDIQLFEMPDDDVDGLILGVEGWSEDDVSAQIYDRDSQSLKIYTQELFVFGLIAGQDPYLLLEEDVIQEIGINHPAIQFILNQRFVWPAWSSSIDELDSNNDSDWDIDGSEWANESVLRQLGYGASSTGPSEIDRRRILSKAFSLPTLPGIESNDQRKRWGAGKSAKRLHAISNFLGWLINLQGAEKPSAKEKWVSDLNWLKNQYFSKTMQFTWPVVINRNLAKKKLTYKTNNQKISTAQSRSRIKEPEPVAGMLVPKHALAAVIGPKTRYSVQDALNAIYDYVERNQLLTPGTSQVNSNDKLFALTGQMRLSKNELDDIVAKNLLRY